MSYRKEKEFSKIIDELYIIYSNKNADYGDAVGKSFEKWGDIALLVRISDKYNRIENLINKQNLVKDETIEDTILDLANYLIIWAMERRLKKEEDIERWEEIHE